jgi:hypothetical protein
VASGIARRAGSEAAAGAEANELRAAAASGMVLVERILPGADVAKRGGGPRPVGGEDGVAGG